MDLTVLSSTNESHLNQFTGLDFETLVDLQKFQGLLHANQKGVPTAPPAQRVPQATQQFSRENSHPDFNDSLSMFDNDSMSDGSDICDRDGRQYFDRQVQKIQKPLISKPDLEVDDGETLGLSKEETDKMLPVALINNYYNYNGMYNILLNDQDQEAVKQDQQHSPLNQHSDSESSDEGIDMCSPSSNCTTGTDSPSPMSDDGASTQQVIPTTQAPGRRKRGPKPPAKYTGNGPIQLFQFILILLLDAKYNNEIIKWTHDKKYEFKLLKPNLIATMWGKRKNKPKMNYEKLSRGLRYYYDKHIIDKVPGKRYVYQFVCDIDKILGYDPTEQKPEGNVEDAVCGEAEAAAESHEFITDHSPETSVDSAVTDWDFTAFFN